MQTDPLLLQRARRFRHEMTPAEARLWSGLRAGRSGVKFARQVPIGPYIADFVARSRMLVIEVDGDTHDDPARDARRDAFMVERGYRVVRFTNGEAMGNLEGVLTAIADALAAPLSQPSPRRGEG